MGERVMVRWERRLAPILYVGLLTEMGNLQRLRGHFYGQAIMLVGREVVIQGEITWRSAWFAEWSLSLASSIVLVGEPHRKSEVGLRIGSLSIIYFCTCTFVWTMSSLLIIVRLQPDLTCQMSLNWAGCLGRESTGSVMGVGLLYAIGLPAVFPLILIGSPWVRVD